jgi:predicted permease
MRVDATFGTYTLLPALGVQPELGRFFDKTEDRPGDYTVMLISHDLWHRMFNGDRDVIGKKVFMDAQPVTIIGVMPPSFDFLPPSEAWLPANMDYDGNRASHGWSGLVRLKDGVDIQAFRDELKSLELSWRRRYLPKEPPPGQPPGIHIISDQHPMVAFPFQQNLVGSLATTLWLLQASVLFVLLIAIVNIANLLLARAETRNREVAVRHALGASRRRLVRQFVTESLVLGMLGGALGILVAVWAVDGVTALIPRSAPRAGEITLDGTAIVFAVGCSVLAALLFGLAPILHAKKTDIHSSLKDGSNRMTGTRGQLRARRALVIAEIALAVLLVVGCTVMVRSFLRLQQVDLGFDPQNALVFAVEFPAKAYPGTAPDAAYKRLEDKLAATPGVRSATLLWGLPPNRGNNSNDIDFPGRTKTPGEPWIVDFWQLVGNKPVTTLGMKLVAGREIDERDTPESPGVVMINEAFAKKFFPGEDPIGKQVQVYDERQTQTIVGVVHDYKQQGVDKQAGTEVFIAQHQWPKFDQKGESNPATNVFIRADGNPRALIPAVTRIMKEIDPAVPAFKVRTMDDVMWDSVARPRFLTFLLTCFAGLALLLAAVGIYGVMAHTVAQRTHEIGLRVALGAQPRQVRSMVLRQAGILVATGVGVGLGAAVALDFALGNSLAKMFYGGRIAQPLLLGGVAVAVTIAALLATWIPVRRATRVEPTVALRSE